MICSPNTMRRTLRWNKRWSLIWAKRHVDNLLETPNFKWFDCEISSQHSRSSTITSTIHICNVFIEYYLLYLFYFCCVFTVCKQKICFKTNKIFTHSGLEWPHFFYRRKNIDRSVNQFIVLTWQCIPWLC